jgi:hypothetical protein
MSSPVKFIDTKNYNKSNFADALKYIIPSLYYEEDYSLKNKEIDILDQVINCHLNTIENFSSVINIYETFTGPFSSINRPEGISKFFIKQNNLTDIDTNDFERKILIPLDKSFRDFPTSADFSEYVEEELLPGIMLNSPSLDFVGGTIAENHVYLINNLSWLYFLNIDGPAGLDYQPSAYVHDLLVDNIYWGKPVSLNDGIKGLTTYIWNNYETCTAWGSLGLLPDEFNPTVAQTSYTSGTQQLDKLLTLIDVVYSPLYIDNSDARVRDAIDDYLANSYKITTKKLSGPFINLMKAFSFAFADYSNNVDRLEILNDLNRCPDEYIPLLADAIGWKLFGSEPDRWRLQLANAVDIYRATGTKKSIQFAVDAVLGQDVFDVSSSITELWESYIPNLIYYSLATESSLLRDFSTWTADLATRYEISSYSFSSMDENIRLCVDQIIYKLVTLYRRNFIFNGKPFPANSRSFSFNYRGRVTNIPPFEEYPYYTNVRITYDMIDSIVDNLVCFGVRNEFAFQVGDYIKNIVFNALNTLAIKNGWLLFTSSVNYPPNWDSVILDISNNRSNYFDLWSSKSSHFRVDFEASGFDFSKDSLEADSKETLKIASQAAQQFSPAHSIPDVVAAISDEDDYSINSELYSVINVDRVSNAGVESASSTGLAGYGASAIAMATYKRGLTVTSISTFGRGDVDSISDSLLSSSATVAILPRRTFRRRDFKNILPKDGFYDRTGFNMPISPQDYDLTDDNFFPLGLIPSSLQYVPIPDYNNIPAIYSICEDMNSANVYSGLAVSNTYPVRGW